MNYIHWVLLDVKCPLSELTSLTFLFKGSDRPIKIGRTCRCMAAILARCPSCRRQWLVGISGRWTQARWVQVHCLDGQLLSCSWMLLDSLTQKVAWFCLGI